MGNGTLVFNGNDISYEIPANQCHVTNEEIWKISELPGIGCEYSFSFSDMDNKLVLDFHVDQNVMLDRIRYDLNPESPLRLTIAKNLLKITEYFFINEKLCTIFDPKNFMLHPKQGTVKLLYRGVRGRMPAHGFEEEPILEQGKRLILLLFTLARYEELLLNGNHAASRQTLEEYRRLVKRLLAANSFLEIENVLEEEEKEIEAQLKFLAKKKANREPKSSLSKWMNFSNLSVPFSKYSPAEFVEGLKAAAVQDYETASEIFKLVDFSRLETENQEIMLKIYLFAGKPEEVEGLAPYFFRQLNQKRPTSPILQFELASYLQDHVSILRLREQVPLDARRQQIVINAQIAREQKAHNSKIQ